MLRSVERSVANRSVTQSEQARACFQRASGEHIARASHVRKRQDRRGPRRSPSQARSFTLEPGSQLRVTRKPSSSSHVECLDDVRSTRACGRRAEGPCEPRVHSGSLLALSSPSFGSAKLGNREAVAIACQEVLDILSWLEQSSEVRTLADIRHQENPPAGSRRFLFARLLPASCGSSTGSSSRST